MLKTIGVVSGLFSGISFFLSEHDLRYCASDLKYTKIGPFVFERERKISRRYSPVFKLQYEVKVNNYGLFSSIMVNVDDNLKSMIADDPFIYYELPKSVRKDIICY